jgi:hypothetical protein
VNVDRWPDAQELRDLEEGEAAVYADLAANYGLNPDDPNDYAAIDRLYRETTRCWVKGLRMLKGDTRLASAARKQIGAKSQQSVRATWIRLRALLGHQPTARQVSAETFVNAKSRSKRLSIRETQRIIAQLRGTKVLPSNQRH